MSAPGTALGSSPPLLVLALVGVFRAVLEVARQIALADRVGPLRAGAATCCTTGSMMMSGVMPVAWIERPFGVK